MSRDIINYKKIILSKLDNMTKIPSYEYNRDICWQPYADWIYWWFCNEKYTPMAQVLIALIWGVLLSPWASGLFFLFFFIIVYEILYYIFTRGDPKYYNVFVRVGVIYASIFGYILGRTLSGDEILYEGVPNMPVISYSS